MDRRVKISDLWCHSLCTAIEDANAMGVCTISTGIFNDYSDRQFHRFRLTRFFPADSGSNISRSQTGYISNSVPRMALSTSYLIYSVQYIRGIDQSYYGLRVNQTQDISDLRCHSPCTLFKDMNAEEVWSLWESCWSFLPCSNNINRGFIDDCKFLRFSNLSLVMPLSRDMNAMDVWSLWDSDMSFFGCGEAPFGDAMQLGTNNYQKEML
ncbi:unnamed protein product [Arabis nemorensis]|uniref:Uncharacterized protein n=1 Tax=Arabis nemorensis TaxID=586526 RepID=A0A565BB66_9BRAS|nr:unnamed protein product [Arabis nemorensis]